MELRRPDGDSEYSDTFEFGRDGQVFEGPFVDVRRAIPSSGPSQGKRKVILELVHDGRPRSNWCKTALAAQLLDELQRRQRAGEEPIFKPGEYIRAEEFPPLPGRQAFRYKTQFEFGKTETQLEVLLGTDDLPERLGNGDAGDDLGTDRSDLPSLIESEEDRRQAQVEAAEPRFGSDPAH